MASRPTRPPTREEYDKEVKARQSVAGRFGFILGCAAALAALGLNLYRLPRPWSALSVVLAGLMAALNVPLGIVIGLIGERFTRPQPPTKN